MNMGNSYLFQFLGWELNNLYPLTLVLVSSREVVLQLDLHLKVLPILFCQIAEWKEKKPHTLGQQIMPARILIQIIDNGIEFLLAEKVCLYQENSTVVPVAPICTTPSYRWNKVFVVTRYNFSTTTRFDLCCLKDTLFNNYLKILVQQINRNWVYIPVILKWKFQISTKTNLLFTHKCRKTY